jgi:uncharacterized protein (DUF362 family)
MGARLQTDTARRVGGERITVTIPNCKHPMDRRTFLQGLALGAPLASLATAEESAKPAEGGKSHVVVAERAEFADRKNVDRNLVKQGVDTLVMKLSGKGNVDEAWRTFVSPRETVAIKFNGLFKNASTSPVVLWAICRGLVDAGVAQEKVIVFDRHMKDFETAAIKPFGDLPKVQFREASAAWDDEVKVGPFKTRLTQILTREADAVINVPCLKHHVIAGVTLTMKNHTGSIPNAGNFHPKLDTIAELNELPSIRKKTRLAICDALMGIFDQGPEFKGAHWTWQAKSLLAATDFVALDAVGAEMIRKYRVDKGRGPTKPVPTHIAHAAEIGLGTADLNKIEVVRV